MVEPSAHRTLVKSPPELWAEISDPQALARHLGEFGEIRITRLEPETAVAWEGDIARGTVALEPSGWGTKVTLTAVPLAIAAEVVPEPVVAPEPVIEPVPEREPEPSDPPQPQPAATGTDAPPEPEQRRGFFARLLGRRPVVEQASETPVPAPEPIPEPEPTPEPEPIVAALPEPVVPPEVEPSITADAPLDADHIVGILTTVLDDLGSARHRPFSRS